MTGGIFLFVLAFTSIFWAGPIAGLYKIFYICYGALFIYLGLAYSRGKLQTGNLAHSSLPLLVFFIYMGLSIIWAFYPTVTMQWVLIDSLYPVIFAAAYLLALNYSGKEITLAMAAIPYCSVLFMLWSYINFGIFRQEYYGEAVQLEGATNTTVGLNLCLCLPFLIWRDNLRNSWYLKWMIALSLLMIVLVQSRGSLVVAILALVLSLLEFGENRSRLMQILSSAGLILIVLGIIYLADSIGSNYLGKLGNRFGSGTDLTFLNAEDELSKSVEVQVDSGRRLMWLVAYRCFTENPIQGVGYMNIGEIFYNRYGWTVVSHGIVTTVFGELGLIGALFYGIMIYYFYKKVNYAIRIGGDTGIHNFLKSCRISMTCTLMLGLFFQIQQSQVFFIILGWGLAISDRLSQNPSMDQNK